MMLKVTNVQENRIRIIKCMNGRDLVTLILHSGWHLLLLLAMIANFRVCRCLSLVLIKLHRSLVIARTRFGIIISVTLLCINYDFFSNSFSPCHRLPCVGYNGGLSLLGTAFLEIIRQGIGTSRCKFASGVERLSLLLL